MLKYTRLLLLAAAAADLESIRKRLDGAELRYTTVDMLHDDLRLMCGNALLYNDAGTEVYRWVLILRLRRDDMCTFYSTPKEQLLCTMRASVSDVPKRRHWYLRVFLLRDDEAGSLSPPSPRPVPLNAFDVVVLLHAVCFCLFCFLRVPFRGLLLVLVLVTRW